MGRLAAATGHDLSIRFFPGDGVRLRDSGQLAVAESIRARLHASWRVRLEVPVSRAPDRRAADMVLENREEMVSVEIERALLDLQAQLRSAQLKRAALAEMIARPVRLVIAVPDTDRNRRVVATIRPLIEAALPVTSRRAWASLGTGMAIGGDALLWVRGTTRESADPRGNKAGSCSPAAPVPGAPLD